MGEWAHPIIAWGPRPAFGMEQVLPGEDPDDPFSDPIAEANDHWNDGYHREAKKILMEACEADLRCLDAHAHLANFVFDRFPELAIRHYEVGLRIGELSLGDDFDGDPVGSHQQPAISKVHGRIRFIPLALGAF